MNEIWPGLPLDEWRDTKDTLHMWTQVVGKVRLALTPRTNHWWNTTLYVTARGLTTSAIPYHDRWFDMEFDFIEHILRIRTDEGTLKTIPLAPRSVADFYRETMSVLNSLGINVRIWTMPVEVEKPIDFRKDEQHHSYDPEYANRFWRILAQSERVLSDFRSRFIGKCSPVHFFWGSFDLAVTRFSGRPAPPREGADSITREAYSHEVCSAGFWPGSSAIQAPAFYSYAAPEPAGFQQAPITPSVAFYSQDFHTFNLLHDEVRRSGSPDETLMDFFQSTYEAAADLGRWDRAALERHDTAA